MSYLARYPVGAFIVDSKAALGPLVAHLRATHRLKGGRNVTTFDTAFCRLPRGSTQLCNEMKRVDAGGSTTASVPIILYEEKDGELGSEELVVVVAGHVNGYPFLEACAHESGAVDAADSFMAVHVTGAWDDVELATFFDGFSYSNLISSDTAKGSSTGGVVTSQQRPPIAFIHQLRCYTRACCPLEALPSPLANLRTRGLQGTPLTCSRTPLTCSELFGGIGMFRMGMERAGVKPAFAVECAVPACAVYATNFLCHSGSSASSRMKDSMDTLISAEPLPPPLVGDITEIPSAFFPSHDVLTAGFPCQSFAKAGPATGLHNSKGWLFFEVVRVLQRARPRAFLLENVENLVMVEGGEQLAVILRHLRQPFSNPVGSTEAESTHSSSSATAAAQGRHGQALRYGVTYRVIDGGLVTPQTRRRVYFIGVRVDAEDDAEVEKDLDSIFDSALEEMHQKHHHHCASASGSTAVSASYTCVRDALLETRLPSRDRCCTSEAALHSLLASLQLTPTQWMAVRRSQTFRQNPLWRLTNLGGNARTLMGSYRTSFQLYSEFVPYGAATSERVQECMLQTATASLIREGDDAFEDMDQKGKGDQQEGGDDNGDEASRPRQQQGEEEEGDGQQQQQQQLRPPLRFFAVRECARLQGIPDEFTFCTEEDQDVAQQQGGTARATRRCLPTGAAYKLIGNAVNPLVIECLGKALVEHIT